MLFVQGFFLLKVQKTHIVTCPAYDVGGPHWRNGANSHIINMVCSGGDKEMSSIFADQ